MSIQRPGFKYLTALVSWRPLENTLPPHRLHDLICSNISAKPSKNKRGFFII